MTEPLTFGFGHFILICGLFVVGQTYDSGIGDTYALVWDRTGWHEQQT